MNKVGGIDMNVCCTPSVECENEDVRYICYKCGKCGRKFNESGIMIDDGGTTVMDDEDFD